MAQGWLIAAKTPGGADKPPSTEVFAVAIADREAALRVLSLYREFGGTDVLVAGEATAELLDQFDVKDGRIQSLWVIEHV